MEDCWNNQFANVHLLRMLCTTFSYKWHFSRVTKYDSSFVAHKHTYIHILIKTFDLLFFYCIIYIWDKIDIEYFLFNITRWHHSWNTMHDSAQQLLLLLLFYAICWRKWMFVNKFSWKYFFLFVLLFSLTRLCIITKNREENLILKYVISKLIWMIMIAFKQNILYFNPQTHAASCSNLCICVFELA